MDERMNAIVVRGLMDFDLEKVPVPDVPEGGLLLKVDACGLCGSDLRTLRSGHERVTFPWILGHELAGEVVKVGSESRGQWREGDELVIAPEVYCGVCDFCIRGEYELCENQRQIAQDWAGGFAEYVAIPEAALRYGAIQRKPDALDPASAAISEPISACVNGQEKGQVGLGDTVTIIGAGPVGCIHASLARARGADKVFMADIAEERLEKAKAFGPDETINASETDLVQEVRSLTDGKGADVVITATPAPIASVQAVEMARKGGRILIFGGLPKDDSKPGADMNLIHYQGLHVIGTTTLAPRHQQVALQLIASGRIPVEELITHRLPLSEFEKGVDLALNGKALKVVFLP